MAGSTPARELLSGNQAIARGAWQAGVTVATGYPGTPSTEILEAAARFGKDLYLEWSPNEKVALEVAAGASLCGARCLVTMKHVGLNVAADPLMTLSYTGVVGGLVIVVADDPGMHSSQNEQDSRHFARFAKVPMLEPADSQEALDFTVLGLEISEKFRTPVLLRSTTRVSHSSGIVALGGRKVPERKIGFEKNIERFVPVPAHARSMRLRVEERTAGLTAMAESNPANRIEWADRELGVIAEGVAYQYVKEVLPGASVLKLGWAIPFPDALIRAFAAGVKNVLVVEELDGILEEHVRSLGIACEGRSRVPGMGELSSSRLAAVLRGMPGIAAQSIVPPSETARRAGGAAARAPRGGQPSGTAAGAVPELPAPGHLPRARQVRRGGDGRHRLLQPRRVRATQPDGHHPLHGRGHLHGPRHDEGGRAAPRGGHGR